MPSSKPIYWVLAALFGGLPADLCAQTPEPPTRAEGSVEAPAPSADPVSKEAPADVDVVNAESTADEAKLGASYRADLSHSVGAKSDVDPITILNVTARYKFHKAFSLSATQRISKLYNKDPGEDEVQLSDTSLRATYAIFTEKDGPQGIGLMTGLDATLPISQFSQDQKHTTVAGINVTGTRTFGILSTLLRPFYRYHVNQYKTLDRDDGGATVVRYRLGILFDASIALPADLSLTSSNQWTERHYEDPPYGSRSPDHDYSFDISLSYAFDKKTTFALGYNESNRAEQLGVVDVNLFDVESTTYYVSAAREF